jgi:hypothetical protein
MKQVLMVLFTLLLMTWAGAVYADPITVTVTRLNAQPAEFIDLTNFNRIPVPNPGRPGGVNFHVGIEPGIGDLHIGLPGGFVFDHASFSQDLFSNPPRFRPGPFDNEIVDLDGGVVLFCTYFNITTTPTISFDITPTPVPEPATLLLLGTGLSGVAMKLRKRRRKDKNAM